MSGTGEFRIGNRLVGPGQPAYIVAEMSGNHNGDLDRATRIVEAAADSGADAIKLQTYRADTLTIDCDAKSFIVGRESIWAGRTLYDLYEEAHTPWHWHPELFRVAHQVGLAVFSTAFDETAVDFLEELAVPAYKVASFELPHVPLLRRIAATGKPVILSTGMATEGEIAFALETLKSNGAGPIVLLKCTSAYPAPVDEMNLRGLTGLADRFGLPVGLSDHSRDALVPPAAVAIGACIIEKHFTLDRDEGGPDAAFSLEPPEFADMVRRVRRTEEALGRPTIGCGRAEAASRDFRVSLFVVEDVQAGDTFTRDNLRVIRPGHGMAPKHYDEVLGRHATRDAARGTPLSPDLIENWSQSS